MSLRTVTATRYVLPLREGGSMPGLVEADDDGLYVLKFRGAGQGPRALVAELVAVAETWASPQTLLVVTDRRLLWLLDDAITGRVRTLRFDAVATIDQRLRWPLRTAVLRVRGKNGRRHAFAGLRPDTAELIVRHVQTAMPR